VTKLFQYKQVLVGHIKNKLKLCSNHW